MLNAPKCFPMMLKPASRIFWLQIFTNEFIWLVLGLVEFVFIAFGYSEAFHWLSRHLQDPLWLPSLWSRPLALPFPPVRLAFLLITLGSDISEVTMAGIFHCSVSSFWYFFF
jgi:hypothetical protein